MEELDSLKNLEILRLDYNEIQEIVELDLLENLKELSLSNNQITELKGLKNLKNLIFLDLRENLLPNLSENRYYDFEYEEILFDKLIFG